MTKEVLLGTYETEFSLRGFKPEPEGVRRK